MAMVVTRMSKDLKLAFPDMKGWSPSNLKYMRAFAAAWGRPEIVQAPLAQLPTPEQLLSKLQTVLAVPSKTVKGSVR